MNITKDAVIERIKMLQAQIQECERNHMLLHGRLEEMKELLGYIATEENKQVINAAEDIAVTPENIVTPVEEPAEEQPCESNTN